MVNIKDFLISDEALARLNDKEVLARHFEEHRPLQELFGFSNNTVAEFYDAAKSILEQGRFEDAVNAFVFLTTLNPYISDFWVGLGVAHQSNRDHDSALFAYNVAFNVDGKEIFPYVLAAQCCMEIKDFNKAIECIDKASKYAEERPEDVSSKKLKEDAAVAKRYVMEQQLRG